MLVVLRRAHSVAAPAGKIDSAILRRLQERYARSNVWFGSRAGGQIRAARAATIGSMLCTTDRAILTAVKAKSRMRG